MPIIVLRVHGLGANWLGCYGNEWVATPNLDRLAAEGTVYDHHFAEALPAIDPFPEDVPRLIDHRAGGPPLAWLRKNWVLPVGSVIVVESDAFVPPWHVPQELLDDYWSYDEEAEPIAELSANDDWRIVQASFAAAVTYFDAEFGALREAVPDASWIVTGTHGISIGERGRLGEVSLHEECVHVPLLVQTPLGGIRVADLTAPGDLVLIANGSKPVQRERLRSIAGSEFAIRTAEWTLLGERLFHRPADRFEIHDVAAMHPEIVAELRASR